MWSVLKQVLGIIGSVVTNTHLRWMRRSQFTNQKLRAYFRDRYDVEVGLYSYGCFDARRMPGPLRVGRYCSVAGTARVVRQNHRIGALTTHPVLYERAFGLVQEDMKPGTPLIVEDDVWIGHGAIILPGCACIGRGAIIGAAAVVTHDVAPYSIVAGNPARKLRDRFTPDLIAAIEASRWWELDFHHLREILQEDPNLLFQPTAEAISGWTRRRAQGASLSSLADTLLNAE